MLHIPNTTESIQKTLNPDLMGGSCIKFIESLMVISVKSYLYEVTAYLILNIVPEPMNTPLQKNWVHRRTALTQTTLDCAARKWFSVLSIEVKSDWKRFTQKFSQVLDSEKKEQHQKSKATIP